MDSITVVTVLFPLTDVYFSTVLEFTNAILYAPFKIPYNSVLAVITLVNSISATAMLKNTCQMQASLSSFEKEKYSAYSSHASDACVKPLTNHKQIISLRHTDPHPAAEFAEFVNFSFVETRFTKKGTKVFHVVFGSEFLITFVTGGQKVKGFLILVKFKKSRGY